MKPLYLKLEDREYEKNQILDEESILWLKKELNLKEKIEPLIIDPLAASIFLRYIPKKSWFNSGRIRTIHGFSHTLRVMLYSYILCKINRVNRFEPYLIAASIHDIKRINDREDASHGEMASKWFYYNNHNIKKTLSKREIKEICVSVEAHEKKSLKDSNSKLSISTILKCADALDRYRLPKRKWWLKKRLIPHPIPNNIINFAKYFTIKTEEDIIKRKDLLNTVLDLAKKYNLIF